MLLQIYPSSMVAHRCQSKKIKIKIKITNLQKSHKIKNKNKKIEKMKKILFRKIPHKIIMDHEYQI